MNKLTLVAFKPEHVKKMKLRDHELSMKLDIDEMESNAQGGPAFTLVTKDGDIVGCGGVSLVWKGVGEAWTYLTPLLYKYPYEVTVVVTEMLDVIIAKHRLHRVSAACMVTLDKAAKWLERMGFEREGILRKYGPNGEDFYQYAKVT